MGSSCKARASPTSPLPHPHPATSSLRRPGIPPNELTVSGLRGASRAKSKRGMGRGPSRRRGWEVVLNRALPPLSSLPTGRGVRLQQAVMAWLGRGTPAGPEGGLKPDLWLSLKAPLCGPPSPLPHRALRIQAAGTLLLLFGCFLASRNLAGGGGGGGPQHGEGPRRKVEAVEIEFWGRNSEFPPPW